MPTRVYLSRCGKPGNRDRDATGMVDEMEDWISPELIDDPLNDDIGDDAMQRGVPRIVSQVQDQKSRIVTNWALRVANMPAFRAMPDLRLEEVQRHIPEVLDGALTAIATSDPTLDPGPIERAADLAAAHGQARKLDDFSVGDVLAEFHALRREVWSALWRVVEGDGESFGLLRELDARLSETFDAISISAAEACVMAPAPGERP